MKKLASDKLKFKPKHNRTQICETILRGIAKLDTKMTCAPQFTPKRKRRVGGAVFFRWAKGYLKECKRVLEWELENATKCYLGHPKVYFKRICAVTSLHP